MKISLKQTLLLQKSQRFIFIREYYNIQNSMKFNLLQNYDLNQISVANGIKVYVFMIN